MCFTSDWLSLFSFLPCSSIHIFECCNMSMPSWMTRVSWIASSHCTKRATYVSVSLLGLFLAFLSVRLAYAVVSFNWTTRVFFNVDLTWKGAKWRQFQISYVSHWWPFTKNQKNNALISSRSSFAAQEYPFMTHLSLSICTVKGCITDVFMHRRHHSMTENLNPPWNCWLQLT